MIDDFRNFAEICFANSAKDCKTTKYSSFKLLKNSEHFQTQIHDESILNVIKLTENQQLQ